MNDPTYVIPLSEQGANLATVGGKGMSLAKLAQAGFSVPGGFHITTEAYRQFVAENHIQAHIMEALANTRLDDPVALEEVSSAIASYFAEGEIPGEIASAISTALGAFENTPLAVRSSATAEDLPGASFAGQQETYLNVRGRMAILDAVKRCWASLWTARAIAYRNRQNIDPQSVALAVVVQELVLAEASGVLFTANPVNGHRGEVLITATWGLGEALVSGAVTPDTLTVQKTSGRVLQRQIPEKQVMTVRTETGTHETPVPQSKRKAAVLSNAQAKTLVKLGIEIETLYEIPMDIEWAWTASKGFAILQARPITALPRAWEPPNANGVYMRTSAADLMPKPLSPLFVTWGIRSLVEQMQPAGERLIQSKPVLQDDYMTSINHYAYMNAAFPAKAWWWILTGLLPAYPRMLGKLVSTWRDALHPEYQALAEAYKDKNPVELPTGELWHDAQEILNGAVYYICGLLFATMGASAGSEGLVTQVYNKFARRPGDPEATVLLMGWNNIPMRAEKSLFDLAGWCRSQPGLAEHIQVCTGLQLAHQLKDERGPGEIDVAVWQEFQSRFEAHLRQFGHIVFQLDFAEPLPLDHPAPMLETIKMYLRNEGSNPYERQRASELLRIQTSETTIQRLKGVKRWAFVKALNWGQSLAEVREDALAEIGLGYPMLRAMLTELGSRFMQAGAIEQAEDIYWLELVEVKDCLQNLEGGKPLMNFANQVAERKEFNEAIRQETPPPMIPMKKKYMGIDTSVWLAESEKNRTGMVLKGVAASPGRVMAPACVLNGPEDFGKMRAGDILVTGTTTPAWTPLFAMASAVVTDIGGPLSHGSIVAREYGIPAVMGTGVATRRIQTGQMITVDGDAGLVKLL